MTASERTLIGRGRHGHVYRGRWGGRDAAFKVLRPSAALDEAEALRVAGALRRWGVDCFVQLLDVTVDRGRWVLVLEWVEGCDVAAALAERGRADDRAVLGVLAQCGAALHTAWTAPTEDGPLRLVHRDLKPSNLLLEADGRIRIADLGLASRCVRPGACLGGTPAYAAPERYAGEEGAPADAYALGAIAYTLRTGRCLGGPGPNRGAHGRRLRAVRADLREAGASAPLVDLVLGLLAWDPLERPTHQALAEHGQGRRALACWGRPSVWSRFRALFAGPHGEAPCTLR